MASDAEELWYCDRGPVLGVCARDPCWGQESVAAGHVIHGTLCSTRFLWAPFDVSGYSRRGGARLRGRFKSLSRATRYATYLPLCWRLFLSLLPPCELMRGPVWVPLAICKTRSAHLGHDISDFGYPRPFSTMLNWPRSLEQSKLYSPDIDILKKAHSADL